MVEEGLGSRSTMVNSFHFKGNSDLVAATEGLDIHMQYKKREDHLEACLQS